jgi:hypothetical protein
MPGWKRKEGRTRPTRAAHASPCPIHANKQIVIFRRFAQFRGDYTVMKVAIMQPYFFPYLGYISLIENTDKFILLDSVQFINQGWIERNRILSPGGGWMYFRVPLTRKSHKTKIGHVQIDNSQDWKRKILAQLQVYGRIAPNYFNVQRLIRELFENHYDGIALFNRDALTAVCQYLNIQKDLQIFSEMSLSIETPNAADEWALNICKSLGGVSEYWNPPGGRKFYDHRKYETAGISMRFQRPILMPYKQRGDAFEPGLSIIDVMMFNSPEEVKRMLHHYEFLSDRNEAHGDRGLRHSSPVCDHREEKVVEIHRRPSSDGGQVPASAGEDGWALRTVHMSEAELSASEP